MNPNDESEKKVTPSAQVDPVGILVCKDLFFVAGVTATARSLGLPMKVSPGLSTLAKMLEESPLVKVVIVDMGMIAPNQMEAWQTLRALVKPPQILAGFGSHVDTSRFTAAQSAGFDHVLPKSSFSGRMVEWLTGWMSSLDGAASQKSS
ncbi:MAG: response regulator [Planctomycetota bacterium]|nr:response regulator [Planctomycetota bacterium]